MVDGAREHVAIGRYYEQSSSNRELGAQVEGALQRLHQCGVIEVDNVEVRYRPRRVGLD